MLEARSGHGHTEWVVLEPKMLLIMGFSARDGSKAII
jgi:hypothetical protein